MSNNNQTWKPTELAGHRVGDLVDLESIGRCEIVELEPPSLLRLRTKTGAIIRCGWKVCRKVPQK